MYIYMRNSNNNAAESLKNEFVFYSNSGAKRAGLESEGEIIVNLTPWWVKNCLNKFIDELDRGPKYRLFFREEEFSGNSFEFQWYHSQEDVDSLKRFLLAHI